MYVRHVYAVTSRGWKRTWDLLKLELQAVISRPTWRCSKAILGPLQEQQAFLIREPPLRLSRRLFKNKSQVAKFESPWGTPRIFKDHKPEP